MLYVILGLIHLEVEVLMSVLAHFLLEHCYIQIYIHQSSFLLVQHSFAQLKLCGLLGLIRLVGLGHRFLVLEEVQQYLQRIRELLRQLLFLQYLVFLLKLEKLCELKFIELEFLSQQSKQLKKLIEA